MVCTQAETMMVSIHNLTNVKTTNDEQTSYHCKPMHTVYEKSLTLPAEMQQIARNQIAKCASSYQPLKLRSSTNVMSMISCLGTQSFHSRHVQHG